jgi:hypothetical protein
MLLPTVKAVLDRTQSGGCGVFGDQDVFVTSGLVDYPFSLLGTPTHFELF